METTKEIVGLKNLKDNFKNPSLLQLYNFEENRKTCNFA
jgi:hypothetical protein